MTGGKKRKMRQAGGATTALSPVLLNGGDSFDRMGAQLAKTAHNLYVQQNYDLAAIKGINVMKGGRRLRKTSKKYSRSRRSKSRRGGGLVEAVVPLGLLAAQQTLLPRPKRPTKKLPSPPIASTPPKKPEEADISPTNITTNNISTGSNLTPVATTTKKRQPFATPVIDTDNLPSSPNELAF
jgi:hypothetical protein